MDDQNQFIDLGIITAQLSAALLMRPTYFRQKRLRKLAESLF